MPEPEMPDGEDQDQEEGAPELVGLAFVGDPDSFVAGWPNSDHNEPDPLLAARKVASGRYSTTDPLPDLPEPPAPEPEPEPAPPAPRPAFWFEEVTPESVAKARAVLSAAEEQAQAAAEAPAEPAAPEPAGDLVDPMQQAGASAAPATETAADADSAQPAAAPVSEAESEGAAGSAPQAQGG